MKIQIEIKVSIIKCLRIANMASHFRGTGKLVISEKRIHHANCRIFVDPSHKRSALEPFTPEENRCIADSSFLLTKAEVIRKIDCLLSETRDHLRAIALEGSRSWPPEIDISTGKISRGENYQSLPYLVLDYPCFFSRDDIFSLRTMFWWANFFSCTLHLQGTYLKVWRTLIRNNIDILSANHVFISVGPTPWEYHYGEDNYARLSQDHETLVNTASFLKLSRKIPLDEIESVKEKVGNFWKLILSLK